MVPLPQIQMDAHLGTPLLVRDPDETIRIAERQRAQQQRVHHAEYRRTGANAEAKDENHKRGEAGIAPHPAKRMLQIPPCIVHPLRDPSAVRFFRH